MDNASPNDTMCQAIQELHGLLGLNEWDAVANQLMYVGRTQW